MELIKLLDYKDSILASLQDASKKLGELDYDSAFNKIYSLAPDPEKLNLSYLYDSINSANSTLSSLGLDNPAFQFFNITEKLCSLNIGFSALEISKNLVDKIKEAATQAADRTKWNEIGQEYDDTWDIEDIVNDYFLDTIPTLTGEQSGLVEKMINGEYKNELSQDAALDLDYQPTL